MFDQGFLVKAFLSSPSNGAVLSHLWTKVKHNCCHENQLCPTTGVAIMFPQNITWRSPKKMLDPHDVCPFESNASPKITADVQIFIPSQKNMTHDWTKHLSIHKTSGLQPSIPTFRPSQYSTQPGSNRLVTSPFSPPTPRRPACIPPLRRSEAVRSKGSKKWSSTTTR